MLVEKVEDRLVPALILALNLLIRQITARGHPSVDLIWEPLNNVRDLDALLPFLDILLILVLAGKHSEGNGDLRRVVTSNHSRMASRSDLEGCAFKRR